MGLFMRTVAKDKVRSWTVIIAVTPTVGYLTWVLYKRMFLGEKPIPREQGHALDHIVLPEPPRKA
ncbi:hypothetical protein BDZ88DRAFT_453888 [Geranomyces variabilis]|nr:hypothetical protein BDZ88DRAFT_453888 [Geranomyces variabilis]